MAATKDHIGSLQNDLTGSLLVDSERLVWQASDDEPTTSSSLPTGSMFRVSTTVDETGLFSRVHSSLLTMSNPSKRIIHNAQLLARQTTDRTSIFSQAWKPVLVLKQFLYHLFFPFSLPLFLLLEGSVAARNQLFGCGSFSAFAKTWGISLMVVTTNIWCLIMLRTWTLSPDHLLLMENVAVTLDAVYVMRCLAIGCKYGFITPVLYSKSRTKLCVSELQAENLSAWRYPNKSVIAREVKLSAYRSGIDLDPGQLSFVYIPGGEEEALLRELIFSKGILGDSALDPGVDPGRLSADLELPEVCRGVKTRMADGRLPGKLFIRAQLAQAFRKYKRQADQVPVISVCFGVAMSTLPFVARLIDGTLPLIIGKNKNFWQPSSDFAALDVPFGLTLTPVLMWIICYFFCSAVLCNFLLVGVLDFDRRASVLKNVTNSISERVEQPTLLALVISPAHTSSSRGIHQLRPRVHLHDPPLPIWWCLSNLYAWYQCRTVLKSVGLRYQKRVQLIASAGLFVLVALVAILLLDLFFQFSHGKDLGYIGIVSGFGFLLTVCLLRITLAGCSSNEQVNVCRNFLGKYKAQIVMSQRKLPQQLSKPDLLRMFDTVDRLLVMQDQLAPVTVFGVRADTTLLRGVGALCVSAFSLLFRQLVTDA